MDLQQYYKYHLFDYAYNVGYDDGKKVAEGGEVKGVEQAKNSIYLQDEFDPIIVMDYLSSYEINDDDRLFIKGLGFDESDFLNEDGSVRED